MKPPFQPTKNRKFDLKFILAADSGGGKTHLCGTYTKGPVHFYMADKGGEKTLEKLVNNRPSSAPPLSVDIISSGETLFSDFWSLIQKDAADGFFDKMAEENGLVVFDSITALNAKAIKEIGMKNRVNELSIGKAVNMKKMFAQPHWGQLLSWMTAFTSTIQELPCAVAATVHIHVLMNSEQEVIARYPSVNGQYRQLIAVDFDEAYLLEARGSKRYVHFSESNKFSAKSRAFSMTKATDLTMDKLASAYLNCKDII